MGNLVLPMNQAASLVACVSALPGMSSIVFVSFLDQKFWQFLYFSFELLPCQLVPPASAAVGND